MFKNGKIPSNPFKYIIDGKEVSEEIFIDYVTNNFREFIDKKELIQKFGKEMARLQKKADKYYYINKDKNMSSYCLTLAIELKDFASKLGVCNEMYEEAKKIYDFSQNGKKDYIPSKEKLEELKNWYDVPTEDL